LLNAFRGSLQKGGPAALGGNDEPSATALWDAALGCVYYSLFEHVARIHQHVPHGVPFRRQVCSWDILNDRGFRADVDYVGGRCNK